nr:hypothetical protein [Tanacetum cinerariifolium]
MCTYLKNMANYKHSQLKNKSFKEIQMLFNNTMKWIVTFVPMDTELVKENESAKLKRCLEIIPGDNDDVTIEATPLSSKSPTIVDYKIYKEGKKSFFKIIRADDKAVNEEMDDSLERADTTASSLGVEQDSGNINKTQSKSTLNEPSSIGTSSGSGPRSQETMRDTIAQTRSRTHKLKRLYKAGLTARVDSSNEASLVDETINNQGRFNDQEDAEMLFDVADELRGEESVKPKADKVVIQKPEQGITTTTLTTTTAAITIAAASTRPKAKGLVIHKQEQAPTPIKDQLMLDEELALKLQAKEEEEKRLAREKSQQIKEVNIAWGDIQEKIELIINWLKDCKVVERRNRPPTRAQQMSIMCTYLKNMEGWKPKSLKNKSFANTQELFNKAMKRVNTFFDYSSKLVVESSKEVEAEVTEGSSKRAGEALEQENAKKQKMEDDKESAELKQCLEIIPEDGDDVTIDATPLSSKSLIIFDYKIHKKKEEKLFPNF